jgi:phage terminase Nu1 subunit (DNA packaging protein)
MIELTRQEIADLRGVTPATVSRAQLRKTDSGKYDLLDPGVWDYVTAPTVEKAIYNYKLSVQQFTDDADMEELKTKHEIRYLEARSIKVELQNAELKRDLMPLDIVRNGWGAWASAVRNNILSVGQRIARGDTALRDRVEKEIKRALEKSIEQSAKEIERIADMPVEVDDDDE